MTNILNKELMFGKSILVTGASGLIGRAIVKTLLEMNKKYSAKIHIYACGRNRNSLEDIFKNYIDDDYLTLCEFDASNEIIIDVSTEFVIHCAATTQSNAFVTSPATVLTDAINGQKNILDFCVRADVSRFVYLSSQEIYGSGEMAFKESELGHLDIYDLRSGYPYSKRLCEMMCVSYKAQYNLDFVCVRLGKVFGPDFAANDKRIGASFLQKAARQENVVLNTKGTQRASYCYIDDAVASVLSIMTSGESGEAYNAAENGRPISAYEFAEICANAGGSKLIVKEQKNDMGYSKIEHMILDFDKLKKLGFVSQYDIHTAVKDAILKLRIKYEDCS